MTAWIRKREVWTCRVEIPPEGDFALAEMTGLESLDQLGGSPFAKRMGSGTNGCQNGIDIAPDLESVESCNLNLIRNSQTKVHTRFHGCYCHLVVPADDCIGRRPRSQGRKGSLISDVETLIAAPNDLKLRRTRIPKSGGGPRLTRAHCSPFNLRDQNPTVARTR